MGGGGDAKGENPLTCLPCAYQKKLRPPEGGL